MQDLDNTLADENPQPEKVIAYLEKKCGVDKMLIRDYTNIQRFNSYLLPAFSCTGFRRFVLGKLKTLDALNEIIIKDFFKYSDQVKNIHYSELFLLYFLFYKC